MANNHTMTLYLGSNDHGIRNASMIKACAEERGMKPSQFVMFCVLEQLKREEAATQQ